MTDSLPHWDQVYTSRTETQLSWHQDAAQLSLELTLPLQPRSVIDIGGGLSRYADGLIAAGVGDVTVLDISQVALDAARVRLGDAVEWIRADITKWQPSRTWELWHDRAVFHFLNADKDRAAYIAALKQALTPGTHALIATFAPDGPDSCSGLPVVRYSPASLAALLDPAFAPVTSRSHRHLTPWGTGQSFQYSLFRRI
ncbi:MAG: class I SAM-dependent methyltransferase [Pseudooceanicola sp.]|nr:class I SAM-dependent methyltransferase [Pseudooceanicola sp.]